MPSKVINPRHNRALLTVLFTYLLYTFWAAGNHGYQLAFYADK